MRGRGAGYKEGKRRRGAPAGGGGAALLSASSTVTTASPWGREASGPGGRVAALRAWVVGGPRWPASPRCCVFFSFSFFFEPFSFLIFVEIEKREKNGILRVYKINLIFVD